MLILLSFPPQGCHALTFALLGFLVSLQYLHVPLRMPETQPIELCHVLCVYISPVLKSTRRIMRCAV